MSQYEKQMGEKNQKAERGLAVFYDPHNVYQFLWYYSTYGKDIEWDALCLPNSFQGEYTSEWLEKTGIFKRIIRHLEVYEGWSNWQQFVRFSRMFGYALLHQQKKFAKKEIAKIVGSMDYQHYNVLTDLGLISGMFLTFGKDSEVSILEDGTADYLPRSYSSIFKKMNSVYSLKGLVLAYLGYCDFSGTFPLRTTKDCIKYCSHPEKMRYTDYREMRKLYDFSICDNELFEQLIQSIFPEVPSYFSIRHEAVLMTTPLTDYVGEGADKYYKRVESYINELGYSTLLLKKHPRDDHVYSFRKGMTVTEIGRKIPAEAILNRIGDMRVYFMGPSSCNLYMDTEKTDTTYFTYKGLEEESKNNTSVRNQYNLETVFRHLKMYNCRDEDIVVL